MQNFTKQIVVPLGFKAKFFFNRIYTVKSVYYHVSVIDKERRSYFFSMEEKNGEWKIIDAPQVPDWIMSAEKVLESTIFENLTD